MDHHASSHRHEYASSGGMQHLRPSVCVTMRHVTVCSHVSGVMQSHHESPCVTSCVILRHHTSSSVTSACNHTSPRVLSSRVMRCWCTMLLHYTCVGVRHHSSPQGTMFHHVLCATMCLPTCHQTARIDTNGLSSVITRHRVIKPECVMLVCHASHVVMREKNQNGAIDAF
jgi:hypothetical protein